MAQFAKDISLFNRLGDNLEAPFELLDSDLTPIEHFFVCNAGDTQHIDPASWQLRILGDAVTQDVYLDQSALQEMPQHEVTAYLECAGNHRTLFEKIDKLAIARESVGEDVPWTLGGIGMASWRGPRLKDVLARAGITDQAAWIGPEGFDTDNPEGPILVPLPAAKALDDDTIIALSMNGAPLPPDHGQPARLVVPGWVGTYWVKWLTRIEVSGLPLSAYRTDEYYVMRTAEGSKLHTLTRQNVKSSLALPWPARLKGKGPHRLHGFARAGEAIVEKVEWSDDGGASWHPANLTSPKVRYAWCRFEFDWLVQPGAHLILTRATTEDGETQPEKVPFNPGSLMYNAIIPHPVTVIA